MTDGQLPKPAEPGRRRFQRLRLGLLLNALRFRAGSSAVFFIVALLAVAAATAGPIYLAAADQSVLAHVVIPPPPAATGLVVNEQPGQSILETAFRQALAGLPRSPTARAFFAAPIYSEIAGAQVLSPAGQVLATADVVARTGDCLHLSFVSGECPSGPGSLSISTRSAALLHVELGATVTLSIGGSKRAYRVSGLYSPASAPGKYWWGQDFFAFGTSLTPPPRVDALFADPSAFDALAPHLVALNADVPVNTRGLLSSQLPAFRRGLSAEELRLGRLGLLAGSGIGAYLADVASQQQAMTTTIAVIDLQLLLLVLMVLFGVAGRIAAGRDQDLALANLRGLSPGALWAVALREPLVLMVVAAPLGAALGWLVALATARAELLAGTPVPFDSLALAAALVASLAAIAATAAGSRRALLYSTDRSPAGRSRLGVALGLAGEAFVIALALAAVVQLSASGVGPQARSQPLAALAPGLIALAAGVIAARAVPLGCRLFAAAIRFSAKLALCLGLQRVAHKSGIIRQAVIIAIAVSLVCFSVAGFFVDRSNRSMQAAFLTGSDRVLTVSVPPTVDFVRAVRQADPSGREAMAAEVTSNSQGTLLAVDAARFARVAAWPNQPGAASPAAVARYLDPLVASDVLVQGGTLEMTIDLRAAVSPRPSLVVGVYNEQYGASQSVTVGPLSPGRHDYLTWLEGDCLSVCQLKSITASWPGPSTDAQPQSAQIPIEIERIAVSNGARFEDVAAGLSRRGTWRVTQDPPGQASSISSSTSGLDALFSYVAGQAPPVIAPADVPELLPAVVTDVVASLSANGPTGSAQYSVSDLDGTPLTVNGAMRVAALPAVGTNAVMVDLNDALRDETLPDIYSVKQVWLSPAAGSGAAVIGRLLKQGIRVTSIRTASTLELAFQKDGPTLAFELFLVVGVESALLATGSMLFAIAATTRRRAVEAVALRAVGLPRRTLVKAMACELGIVCATGLVAGAVAGIAAARFCLPSVPEFTGLSGGAPLRFDMPVGWLLVVVAGAAALLGAVSAISVALVGAASTPDKLRISQR
ncbi:MAG: FtsX-like permease family protein [Acidimicrobiales bacterium]